MAKTLLKGIVVGFLVTTAYAVGHKLDQLGR